MNRPADIKNISLTFKSAVHYFDVYTSTDGINYTLLKSVTAENAAEIYTTTTVSGATYYVYALDANGLEAVTYIKVMFTGRPGSTFVNLGEISFSE